MAVIRLRTDDLAWHEVEGSIICLDLVRSRYLSINAAGAALWSLLIEGAEQQALARQLVDTFGISDEQADRDVSLFLSGLEERGLLVSS